MELTQQDLVRLVGDALVKFCPKECDYGHEVDVSRSIGPGDLEKFVENWTKEAQNGQR